jgi:beta-lactamase regulating signal transducer with metallopeptidase domain
MLYATLAVSLIAAACALLAMLRERSGRSSRAVWCAGLLFAAALVVTAPWRVAPAMHTVAIAPAMPATAAPAPIVAPSVWQRAARWPSAWIDRSADLFAVASRWPASVQRVTAAFWLLSSASIALVFGLVVIGMHRRRARWPRAMLDGVPVRITDGVGPLVVGVAEPEIALPPWIVALPAPARRVVLAHEIEHQRARDPLLLALGGLAVLVTPWHPLAWWMLRRLGAAIELDCDARVLGRGVAAREYGMLLLDIASRSRPRSLLTPWPTLGVSSHLERRLIAMTSGAQRVTTARMAVAGLAAAAMVLAACESKLPTSAEIDAMDGKQVLLSRAPLLRGDSTTFWIDGRRVTEERLSAVQAEAIASMEVRKATGPGSFSEVRVRTKEGELRGVAEETLMGADSSAAVIRFRRTDSTGVPAFIERRVGDSGVTVMRRSSGRVSEEPTGQVRSTGTFDGILLVDGVEKPGTSINAIPPQQIVSVNVTKGEAARGRFPNDPRAANGIIEITTRATAKP